MEPDNACVRALRRAGAAFDREAWDEFDKMYSPDVIVESRRRIVGFTRDDLPSGDWPREARRLHDIAGAVRAQTVAIAVRGERLALTRLEVGYQDTTPGAPRDEALILYGLDENGRIALHVFFDLDDMDAAMAELDAAHARLEERQPRAPLENAASRAEDRLSRCLPTRRWDEIGRCSRRTSGSMTGGKDFAVRAMIARRRSKMSVRSPTWASTITQTSLSTRAAIVSVLSHMRF